MICNCFNFISNCYHIKYIDIYVFCLFLEYIFLEIRHLEIRYKRRDKIRLQLPLHLSRPTIKGYYLSSTKFKSKSSGVTMHGSSFKDRNFVVKELLKLNNTINNNTEHCYIFFLIIKYLWLFNMLDLSIDL